MSRSITVTGFQSASGFVNLLTPTSAVVMGGLTLAKVRYDRYLRFLAPFLVAVFLVAVLAMVIGANVSPHEVPAMKHCHEDRRRTRGQRAAAPWASR